MMAFVFEFRTESRAENSSLMIQCSLFQWHVQQTTPSIRIFEAKMTQSCFPLAVTLAILSCSPALTQTQNNRVSNTEIVLASEVKWKALNPARGDRSPQAGTLWGDQTKDNESGFLVKFVDGFSSPPHIHNITYRGIVIGGRLHNDDPEAEPMWMKEGSWWTQPAGEVHITSARGSSIGYVEIQSGPYLVKPSTEAFDNGERPVNMDASNIFWLDASDTSWIEKNPDSNKRSKAEMTFLWGAPEGEEVNGTMLKLPPGYSGILKTESSTFRVVVVKGTLTLHDKQVASLPAASYFGSEGLANHRISNEAEAECVLYIRTRGQYSVRSH